MTIFVEKIGQIIPYFSIAAITETPQASHAIKNLSEFKQVTRQKPLGITSISPYLESIFRWPLAISLLAASIRRTVFL